MEQIGWRYQDVRTKFLSLLFILAACEPSYAGSSRNIYADSVKSASGSGALNLNASGTVTVPNATDTLVGKATTDTLTNKTINASSNTISNIADANISSSAAIAVSKLATGSSGQVVKMVGATPTWATFSGGINYLSSNPDAESDTSNWGTYANASAKNIPDGTTTGSPNTTWTRTTSSPLRGAGSFLWTKSGAASRQGEGVYYNFTIDSADQAKPLAITFDYNVASGTFTASNGSTAPLNDNSTTTNAGNSDIEAFVYDVTNGVLIPVAPQVLTCSTSLPCTFKGTFQTSSNSTSYRLLLHNATTTTNNFTLKFDNFFVGPQSVSYGDPITDWVSFTPVVTGFGTSPTKSGLCRRIGDSAECYVTVKVTNTTGASSLSVGTYLPSGWSVDTNKMPDGNTNQGVGNAWWFNTSTGATYTGNATWNTSSGMVPYGDSGALQWNATVPSAILTSTEVILRYTLPIAGFSSTVQMSNDTDTRVIAMKATGSPPTGTLNSSVNQITYGTVVTDKSGSYSAGTYTVPVSGVYRTTCSMYITFTGATANQYAGISVKQSGVSVGANTIRLGASATEATPVVSTLINAVAGDTITCNSQTNTSSPTFISDAPSNFMAVERLSGPSTIAASETLAASYVSTAGTALSAGAVTTIALPTKKYDTHSGYNTSTGIFTCPISGKFSLKAHLTTAAVSLTTSQLLNIRVRNITSGEICEGDRSYGNGTAQSWAATVACSMQCNAGEQMDLQYFISAAGNLLTTAGYNYLQIERVGN
jgi:hypothetical protein